jgi:hypothetical protein
MLQFGFAALNFPSFRYTYPLIATIETALMGSDITRNLTEKEKITDGVKVENCERYLDKSITNSARLPTLLWGLANTGKGLYDVVDYLISGRSPNWAETNFNLSTGIEHLALASSIYFKARDPALLEKNPAWKNALNKVKEKIQEMLPQPEPQPVPVRANYSLENKLK